MPIPQTHKRTAFKHSRTIALVGGLLALAVVAQPAQAQTTQPVFEVASVKPAARDADPATGQWSLPNIGRFNASHISLAVLIRLAYDIDDSQIANKPDWLEENLYDVVAKPEDGIKLSREELRPRLQNLLRQRFHLVTHTDQREGRGYALTPGKTTPTLAPTSAEHFPGWRTNVSPGQMRGVNWTMPQFAKFLTEAAGFPVLDETGVTGSYDISFAYNPNPDAESPLPPLPDALKAATGLILKPKKIPVQTLVIESVDKIPTDN